MFATAQVTQNKAEMKDEGGRISLYFVLRTLCFVLGSLGFTFLPPTASSKV